MSLKQLPWVKYLICTFVKLRLKTIILIYKHELHVNSVMNMPVASESS